MKQRRLQLLLALCELIPSLTRVGTVRAEEPIPPAFMAAPNLQRFGIGVGVAAAFQTKLELKKAKDADQSSVGVSAMPYVTALPAYWFAPEITRNFCATQALKLERKAAQQEADKYAEGLAAAEYKREMAQGCKWPTTCAKLTATTPGPRPADLAALKQAIAAEQSHADRAVTCEQREDKIDTAEEAYDDAKKPGKTPAERLAAWNELHEARRAMIVHCGSPEEEYTGWEPGVPARCWTKGFGLYFGVPIAYDAPFNSDDIRRTVKPLFSFGFVWAPAPYVNVLAGITRTMVEVPIKSESDLSKVIDTNMRGNFQFTIGLGGTVDTIGSLVKPVK